MATLVDKLLGRGKTAPTSATIRVEVTKAEGAMERARQALAEARAAYHATLLDEDASAPAAAKAKTVAAEVDVDRAEAIVADLRTRFLDACEAEAEAERVATYAAARDAHDFAARRISEYEAHARAIVAIIDDVAQAELVVAEANKDLPTGAEPLLSPELSARSLPPVPREVVSETTSDAGWFYIDGPWVGTEVEQRFHREVKSEDGRIGTFRHRFGNYEDERDVVVVRRQRRVTRYLPPAGRAVPYTLAQSVVLPGHSYGDPMFLANGRAKFGATEGPPRAFRIEMSDAALVDDDDLLAEAAALAREGAERR